MKKSNFNIRFLLSESKKEGSENTRQNYIEKKIEY